jgi:hypothetical protein
LYLNDNEFGGRVPNGIGTLDKLETLMIGDNNLSGDVPKEFCRLQDLQVISVDCESLGCDCCTECADEAIDAPSAAMETLAPTGLVTTESPTTATPSPTSCVNAINVLSACYTPGDEIGITFSNCEPQGDDWVGVYSAGQDYNSLPNPPVWSWSCGNRNCRDAVSSMDMSLSQDQASDNGWPLDVGTYVVVLARNSAQPYTAYAVSPEFSIQDGC